MAIRHWPSLVYAAGLLCIYVGERILAAGGASVVLTVIGVSAVLGRLPGAGLRPARPRPAFAAPPAC